MRFVRPIFTFSAFISLLLCAATVTLWMRSYSGMEGFGWERRDRAVYFDDGTGPGLVDARICGVVSSRGSLWIGEGNEMIAGEAGRGARRYTQADPPPLWSFPYHRVQGGWSFAAVSLHGDPDGGDRGGYRGVISPHWAVAMLTALLPALWLKGRFARRRVPGCCEACGYDLRASRGRCPECGCAIRGQVNRWRPRPLK